MKTKRTRFIVVGAILVVALGLAAGISLADLTGSDFEIDPDANLRVDGGGDALDWMNVSDIKKGDEPSGQNDDSFGQGTKEDTEPPTVVDGSIPPNKSDLKTFGVYQEENASGKFLHLFWTRVQDPSGTTNMDFEFNQSNTASANGVTPVRTAGDLLIVYELSKGGTVPELFLFTWLDGNEDPLIPCEASNSYPCWGDRTDLGQAGDAEGSINSSAIPDGESDGLGPLDPRTFGEASIDLSVIFDPYSCTSFGSAYLKSRSSDSFTAALKDFIAPQPVNITNCGTVIIRKVTDPSPDPTGTSFGFTSSVVTDPPNGTSFSLVDGGVWDPNNVVFDTGYTVTEDDPSSLGFDLYDIACTCSVSANCIEDEGSRTATFDVVPGGTVDCTFKNRARGTIIVEKQTEPNGAAGDFTFTGDAAGTIQDDGQIIVDDLAPGTYTSTEVDPSPAFDLTDITCDDGGSASVSTGDLTAGTATFRLDPGETVKCIFTNTQRGKITVEKVTNPDGSSASFPFTLTGGPDGLSLPFNRQDGQAAWDSGWIKPGDYAVAEGTLPDGWALDSAECSVDGAPATPYNNGSTLTLAAGQTIACTFYDSTGAILITKTAKDHSQDGDSPLGGVTFDVKDGDGIVVATVTTDNSTGQVCVGGLVANADYTVVETDAPDGYAFDDTPKDVTAAGAECDGAGTPAGVAFVNDPLSEIVITFNSLAGDGKTVATSVVCVGPSLPDPGSEGGPLNHGEFATFPDLLEGEYVCTIMIDP